VSELIQLRPLNGLPGSRLATLLGTGLEPVAPLRGVTGCLERTVAEVSASDSDLAAARQGLPDGPALPEALAVRLRARDVDLHWGEPVTVPDLPALLDLCRARGRSSVELARADPSLVPGMQLGAWFDAPWRTRALRRIARALPVRLISPLARISPRWLAAVGDLAFWAGVRRRTTRIEWRRLTASSYVALVYHRFAGELKPGQERIDIAPTRFARQLRALRLAGFRPLPAEEIVSFHAGTIERVPRRSVAITVDDALADSVAPLMRHGGWAPQLFVSTRELGGAAHWLDGEPVAGWDDVRTLAEAGIAIGSHARSHRRLSSLAVAEREEELAGSLADLREHLAAPLEVVAFPYGDHDAETCRAARAAGFRAAFTTAKGRNGAGTDPHCLKRVSIHGHDGVLAVLWKVLTGEGLPAIWLRLRGLRRDRGATA
jgi:peptidoglycan/xylan/chitin deacetylase (PgdA/CDA1 family)